jgi:hypothetical protein
MTNALVTKVWWCGYKGVIGVGELCTYAHDREAWNCGSRQLAPIDAVVVLKENVRQSSPPGI